MKKIMFILLLLLSPLVFCDELSVDTVEYTMLAGGAPQGTFSYPPRASMFVWSQAGKLSFPFITGSRLYTSLDTGKTYSYYYAFGEAFDAHGDLDMILNPAGTDTALWSFHQAVAPAQVEFLMLTDNGSAWTVENVDSTTWDNFNTNYTVLYAQKDRNSDMVLSFGRAGSGTDAGLCFYSTDGGVTWGATPETLYVSSGTVRIALENFANTLYHMNWSYPNGLDVWEYNNDNPPSFTQIGDSVIGSTQRGFSYMNYYDSLFFVVAMDSLSDANVEIHTAFKHKDSTEWVVVPSITAFNGGGALDLPPIGLTLVDDLKKIILHYGKFRDGTNANWADSMDIAIRGFDWSDTTWEDNDFVINNGYGTLTASNATTVNFSKFIPAAHGARLYFTYTTHGGDAADTDVDWWFAEVEISVSSPTVNITSGRRRRLSSIEIENVKKQLSHFADLTEWSKMSEWTVDSREFKYNQDRDWSKLQEFMSTQEAVNTIYQLEGDR